MKINKILGNPEEFLKTLFEKIELTGIDVSELELDHICYRVETLEKYLELKEKISKIGKLLIENLIGGRQISTFRLEEPIVYKNRKIYLLELPSPKEGSNYDNGYEHVEFVINDTFTDFMNKYSEVYFTKKAINKKVNPDIKIKFSEKFGKYKNISVKFHFNSLDEVIKFRLDKNKSCPCGTSEKYINCCGKYHFGGNAENALILMKSRYSAYAENKPNYIIKTTHKNNSEYNSNKIEWKKEIEEFSKNSEFLSLEIIEYTEGESESFVTFKAKLDSGEIYEKSRFLKVDGVWLYESGEFI